MNTAALSQLFSTPEVHAALVQLLQALASKVGEAQEPLTSAIRVLRTTYFALRVHGRAGASAYQLATLTRQPLDHVRAALQYLVATSRGHEIGDPHGPWPVSYNALTAQRKETRHA